MRVLFLSTYPSSGPDSGGVVRLKSLMAALAARRHVTHVLAIVTPHAEDARSSSDETIIPLRPGAFSAADARAVGFHDTLTGLRLSEDPARLRRAIDAARDFRPDVLIQEQPFLADLAAAIAQDLSVPLVYSAANQEHQLKQDLIRLVPEAYVHSDPLLDEVARLERRAAKDASLSVAIAPTSSRSFFRWAAARLWLPAMAADRLMRAFPLSRHP